MADGADKKCEERGAGAVIVRIPPIRRYEIDCCGNAIQHIEGGEWVRYNYHVASMVVMQSEIEELEEQIAELKEKLRDAKLEAKDFQNAAIDATVEPVKSDRINDTQLIATGATTPSAPTVGG